MQVCNRCPTRGECHDAHRCLNETVSGYDILTYATKGAAKSGCVDCPAARGGPCHCILASRSPPPMDEREAILTEAMSLVRGSRNTSYGEPEDNFRRIAAHWVVYFKNRFGLDIPLMPVDVALLMDLMKTARLEYDIMHRDSWVDKPGYAACGAAIVANMKRDKKPNA